MAIQKRRYHIGIVGSRTFTDYELFCDTIHRTQRWTDIPSCHLVIVSGGAAGVDRMAEKFAGQNMIRTKVHLPQWQALGKSAGFVRNRLIVEDSDLVIAFWDGLSAGTKSTIDLARQMKKETFIYYF